MKILLTGSTGQVGHALLSTLAPLGEIVAPTRADLDLAHPPSVRAFVREVAPRWIVNPGAYTAVDRAESETHLAHAVNAEAPRVMGEEAARLGAAMIHFSTDYVFPGTGHAPWRETDQPAPLGVYGGTKLEGEHALAGSGAAHVILRTSWVYSATGKNFLRTILKAALERPELRIVADQFGAPTSAQDLATLTAAIITHCESLAESKPLPEALAPISGLYHAANSGVTSWFGFAEAAVAAERPRHLDKFWATLTPIRTDEYPTPAKRPANSRLDCTRLRDTFQTSLPPWEQSLAAVLAELAPQLKADQLGANPH